MPISFQMSIIRTTYFGVCAILIFFVLGCTDVTPTIGALKNIGALQFEKSVLVVASLTSVPLQAQCSFKGDIEVSFDGGNTWVAPTTHDSSSSNSCVNGSFKMTVSKDQPPLQGQTFSAGSILSLKFRTKLLTGTEIYNEVSVTYSPATSISQELLAASQVVSGTGYSIKGRVRMQQQQVSSGGAFVVHGRITK